MMNRLQRAMDNADIEELVNAAQAVGAEAVQVALAAPIDGKAEVEAQRQRDLDAALADAIEVVARHRARLGRRVCSRKDGETVRRIFELLRGLLDGGADADPSFQ
jgi:hypothetical protein